MTRSSPNNSSLSCFALSSPFSTWRVPRLTTGVVNQDVDVFLSPFYLLDEFLDRLFVRDIALESNQPAFWMGKGASPGVNRVIENEFSPRCDVDSSAMVDERLRYHQTDTGAAPSDDASPVRDVKQISGHESLTNWWLELERSARALGT